MMLKHLPRLGASYTGVLQLECLSFVPLLQAASFVNHNQVKKFTDMGLKAAFVGEAQDDQSVEQGVKNGEYSLVYMSPESMMTVLQWREMFRSQLYQQRLKSFISAVSGDTISTIVLGSAFMEESLKLLAGSLSNPISSNKM